MKRNDADWGGMLRQRRRWGGGRGFWGKLEWGRWMYKTNCFGDTKDRWWEWENP